MDTAPSLSSTSSGADVSKVGSQLTTLTFSGDDDGSEAVTMCSAMRGADFSGKLLGVAGTIIFTAFLPRCPVLTHVDLSENFLSAEGAGWLVGALRESCTLQSLTVSGLLIDLKDSLDDGEWSLGATVGLYDYR
jgi:hypothetical protein